MRPSFSSTVPQATCEPWAKVQDDYICSICKMRVAEPPSEIYGEKSVLKVRIFPKSMITSWLASISRNYLLMMSVLALDRFL